MKYNFHELLTFMYYFCFVGIKKEKYPWLLLWWFIFAVHIFFCWGPSIKYVHKIFRKTNISNPLIRPRTCAYQGVRNNSFSKIFAYVLNGWPPVFVIFTKQKSHLSSIFSYIDIWQILRFNFSNFLRMYCKIRHTKQTAIWTFFLYFLSLKISLIRVIT